MTDILIVTKKISKEKLRQLAKKTFGDLVKAVVDINRGVLAVGGTCDENLEKLIDIDGVTESVVYGLAIGK